jgi:hypothetical protein
MKKRYKKNELFFMRLNEVILLKQGASLVEDTSMINPLNAELNPICFNLALLGAHHILHVSRIRVNIQHV